MILYHGYFHLRFWPWKCTTDFSSFPIFISLNNCTKYLCFFPTIFLPELHCEARGLGHKILIFVLSRTSLRRFIFRTLLLWFQSLFGRYFKSRFNKILTGFMRKHKTVAQKFLKCGVTAKPFLDLDILQLMKLLESNWNFQVAGLLGLRLELHQRTQRLSMSTPFTKTAINYYKIYNTEVTEIFKPSLAINLLYLNNADLGYGHLKLLPNHTLIHDT